ncbi:hypothetical protein IID20_03395 [Patescibacteria group bacterium]|nr:hypothetical protein [Patescibacteria group bacterium]
MTSLNEQLFKVGLITEKQFHEADAEEELKNRVDYSAVHHDAPISCANLDYCDSMQKFKQDAKEILLGDASQIKTIIKKAHRFKGQPGSKKFIWFFYQVQDALNNLPIEKREQLLKRAFRKAGFMFTISK